MSKRIPFQPFLSKTRPSSQSQESNPSITLSAKPLPSSNVFGCQDIRLSVSTPLPVSSVQPEYVYQLVL